MFRSIEVRELAVKLRKHGLMVEVVSKGLEAYVRLKSLRVESGGLERFRRP